MKRTRSQSDIMSDDSRPQRLPPTIPITDTVVQCLDTTQYAALRRLQYPQITQPTTFIETLDMFPELPAFDQLKHLSGLISGLRDRGPYLVYYNKWKRNLDEVSDANNIPKTAAATPPSDVLPDLTTCLRVIKTFDEVCQSTEDLGNFQSAAMSAVRLGQYILIICCYASYRPQLEKLPQLVNMLLHTNKVVKQWKLMTSKAQAPDSPPIKIPEDDEVTTRMRGRVLGLRVDLSHDTSVLSRDEWVGPTEIRDQLDLKVVHKQLLKQHMEHTPKPCHILLYGPSGCGKTSLVRCISKQAGVTYFEMKMSEMIGNGVGEAEKFLKMLFDEAAKLAPALIFIDDIDSMFPVNIEKMEYWEYRLIHVFKSCITAVDNSEKDVSVIGATNHPWRLDRIEGLSRRFDIRLFIDFPDKDSRRRILQMTLEKVHHKLAEDDISILVNKTRGRSSDQIMRMIANAEFVQWSQALESMWFEPLYVDGEFRYLPCEENAQGALLLATPEDKNEVLIGYRPLNLELVLKTFNKMRRETSVEMLEAYALYQEGHLTPTAMRHLRII